MALDVSTLRLVTSKQAKGGRRAPDAPVLTSNPPAPSAPPAPAPDGSRTPTARTYEEWLDYNQASQFVERAALPDHVSELIKLLGKTVDALTAITTEMNRPIYGSTDGTIPPTATINPANFDWDPTDTDPDLADPEFSFVAPDRPQVGDAPDIETNPFGIPGLSWPPAPKDVVA